MREIDININKAKIKAIAVEFTDDLPNVTATISLFAGEDKEVTTFTLGTRKYFNDTEFELPVGMIPTINRIGQQMEEILVRQCQKQMSMIEDKSVNNPQSVKRFEEGDSQYVDVDRDHVGY